MNHLSRLAIALLLSGICAGCASLRVTYHSEPEGALLYEGGTLWGVTPMTLKYQMPSTFTRQGDCLTLRPSTVRWASGAEASIPGLQVCPQQGREQQFVFARPTGLPGRELDVQVAIQSLQNQLTQQLVAAEQDAAFWQLYGALIQQNRAAQQTLNCTSNVIGQTVFTSCR